MNTEKQDDIIASWIRDSRRHAGMTMQQLGEAVCRTKANVSQWEAGKHAPSYEIITKIAAITGCKMPDGQLLSSSNWPFKTLTEREWESLSERAKGYIDARLLALAKEAKELYG